MANRSFFDPIGIFSTTRTFPVPIKTATVRPVARQHKERCTAGRTPHLNRSKDSSRLGFAAACFCACSVKIPGYLKQFI
jgi:hypothetical protein